MPAQTRFEYDPPVLYFGPGVVAELERAVADAGGEHALLVCGRTVGSTPAVIDPIVRGLGERYAGLFAETTPDKRLSTAAKAADRLDEVGADVIVAVGGGSSLDVATSAAALVGGDLTLESAAERLSSEGTFPVRGEPIPLVVIPTTLAGADLSFGAGITADPSTDPVEEPVRGGIADPRLMPAAAIYDAELVATTPPSILRGSAMNGYDKGIETIYSPVVTPVTDAAAMYGLELLTRWLPAIGDEPIDVAPLSSILEGLALVQYGIARPDTPKLSLIHAFGHGLTATAAVQQGVAHGIMVPHVLRFVFDRCEGRRALLARAVGVANGETDPADGIVEAVADVRDALGLPRQLRAIDDLERDDLERVARRTAADSLMANQPAGLEATEADLLALLETAW